MDVNALRDLIAEYQTEDGPKIKVKLEFDTETMTGFAYIWDGQQLNKFLDLAPEE